MFGAADANERGDVLVALRALSRYRMLVWTLERMGITTPARLRDRRAPRGPARRRSKGAAASTRRRSSRASLALLARMTAVRTLDAKAAQKLVEQLVAVPVNDNGAYRGAMARWLRDVLLPAIPRAATSELAVLGRDVGPAVGRRRASPGACTWEGQTYRLDLGASERQRLQRVREKQEGAPLDAAIELGVAARALAVETIALDDAQAIVDRLTALAADIPRRVGHDAGGHDAARRLARRPTPSEAVQEGARGADAARPRQGSRSAPPAMAESLNELADDAARAGAASIAYAADVGDPDGAVLLADDVSRRHDFGFGAKDAEMRLRSAWAVPRPEVTPGVPWHVNGSLLGLDIALAPLALRRLNFERVLEAPKLTSNERDSIRAERVAPEPVQAARCRSRRDCRRPSGAGASASPP